MSNFDSQKIPYEATENNLCLQKLKFLEQTQPKQVEVVDSKQAPVPSLSAEPTRAEVAQAPVLAGKENQADTWQEPLLFGEEFSAPEIQKSMMPTVLSNYVWSLSEELQVQHELVFSCILSVLASVAMRKFKIHLYKRYYEPLNFYSLCLLKPGNKKSAVDERATEILRTLQSELNQSEESSIEQNEVERSILLKQYKKLSDKAASQEDIEKRDTLMQQALVLKRSIPQEKFFTSLYRLGGMTVERLFTLMLKNNEYAAIFDSEGDFFRVLGGAYTGGNPTSLDLILKAHRGEECHRARQTDNTDLVLLNPLLTMSFVIQPTILENRQAAAKEEFKGRGLDGRFCYFVPRELNGERDAFNEAICDSKYEKSFTDIVRRVYEHNAIGENISFDGKAILELDKDAQYLFKLTENEIDAETAEGKKLESISSWALKEKGQMARVAGLFHLCLHNEPEKVAVSGDTMQMAIDVTRNFLEPHARKALGMLEIDPVVKKLEQIYRSILKEGLRKVSHQWLYQKHKAKVDGRNDGIAKLIEHLKSRNILKDGQAEGRKKMYLVNPLIFETAAQK